MRGQGLNLMRNHITQKPIELDRTVLHSFESFFEEYQRHIQFLADTMSIQTGQHIHMLSRIIEVLPMNVNPSQCVVRLIHLLGIVAITDDIESLFDTIV